MPFDLWITCTYFMFLITRGRLWICVLKTEVCMCIKYEILYTTVYLGISVQNLSEGSDDTVTCTNILLLHLYGTGFAQVSKNKDIIADHVCSLLIL